MTRREGLALAGATVCFVAGTLASSDETVRAQAGTTRTVYISALDAKGAFVTNLVPGDLAVAENGQVRTVTGLVPANEPCHVAVLVDDGGDGLMQAPVAELLNAAAGRARFAVIMLNPTIDSPERLHRQLRHSPRRRLEAQAARSPGAGPGGPGGRRVVCRQGHAEAEPVAASHRGLDQRGRVGRKRDCLLASSPIWRPAAPRCTWCTSSLCRSGRCSSRDPHNRAARPRWRPAPAHFPTR